MKRIAIISPCILPVPACLGGAVEGLITRFIEDNEQHDNYIIDLFSIADGAETTHVYSNTNIIYVRSGWFGKMLDRILDKFFRTVQKSSIRILDSYIVESFTRRLDDINVDYDAIIIENMMSTACEIVKFCKGKYSSRFFFHMHNEVDIYRSPKQIKELVNFGVIFIATSEFIKNQILKQNHNAQVSVLYGGVDYSSFGRAGKRDSDKVSLLYAGRIIPGKGVKELLMAFISILEIIDDMSRKRLNLTIVGFSGFDRKYENEIRRIADKYSNIECVDQVPAQQMSLLYDTADVVLVPSLVDEAFGLVALETMAKGIPLIVTNAGALPEVVGDGACIVSKDENFIMNLSDAIGKVAFDETYRDELSLRGYERSRSVKAFDINNYYSCLVNIIDSQEITSDDTISVIIPVYNVSSYIRRCIDSVTCQTYRNLEIILIDDGSTDDSGNICDELASSDNRIRVIHQTNMGLSGARNTGLDHAVGRYIFFCDSDDYIKDDCLEKMIYRLKRDHADIVACGFDKVFDSDGDICEENAKAFTDLKPGRWSGPESVIQMMRNSNVCSAAWNKLYCRDLFDGIRFVPGVQNEDEFTIYKVLYRAGIVSYIPDVLYRYYQRESSIMHENLAGRYRFFIEAALDSISYFRDRGENDLVQHSMISLLEWIKYSYRNIEDSSIKHELAGIYKDNCSLSNVPSVMGLKKQIALLIWKYIRY